MTELMEASTEPVKTAQTEAPDTEPSGWMSPDGSIRDGAPEAVANLMKTKGWDTVEKIVEGFVGLEQFKGVGEHLVIPETDDAEAWANVYKQLGRPEDHTGYELKYDGEVELSDELTGQFKQFAHGLGLSQNQFDKIVNFQLDAVGAQGEALTAQQTADRETNISAMKTKWGQEYEATNQRIDSMADKLGVLQFLKDQGIDKEPEIVNMLLTIANSDREDSITPGGRPAPTKSAPDRLREIMASDAFKNKFHRDHKTIMVEYMGLNQEIANSGQGQAPRM